MGTCHSTKNQTIKASKSDTQTQKLTTEANLINNENKLKEDKKEEINKNEIKIEIFSEDKNLGINIYNQNDTLLDVLRSLVKDLNVNSEFLVLKIEPNAEKDITNDKDKKLSTIFDKNSINMIRLQYINPDLNTNDILKKYYKTTLIGSPRFESDPNQIIIYNKLNNSLNFYPIDFKELNYFSAYCNGLDFLYISGGDKIIEKEEEDKKFSETVGISNFYKVNLNTLEISKLVDLIIPRSWHSMIYLPPKWIFIVGGSFTKTVELYDCENNIIKIDSELNEIRAETTLCIVNNNFIYAFCGFQYQKNYIDTVERCDLKAKRRNWEYINIKDWDKYCISFFSVGYFKENKNGEIKDSILFIGGNRVIDGNSNFNIYKFSMNSVEEFGTLPYGDQFSEKFFLPLDEEKSALIPISAGDNLKVVFIKTGGVIESIELSESEETNRIKKATQLLEAI